MKEYTSLVIGDYHILNHTRNKYLSEFHDNMFRESFDRINDLLYKYNIKNIKIVGDLLDVPEGKEALNLVSEFFQGLPEGTEIEVINGNHELYHEGNNRKYHFNVLKYLYEQNFNLEVFEYSEIGNNLYCGHGSIHKLERINKNYDIIYSHFRSGLAIGSNMIPDEIDITRVIQKAKLVVLGDIHKRLAYENIVYTGSPCDTHFSNANSSPDHQPSILLLNENTLDWEWVDTLTTKYRKKKETFSSVKKFLEEVDNLKEDAETNNCFYKIVIQDKKANLKRIQASEYETFAILELVKIDIEIDKQNQEVVHHIKNNLASNNVSENCLTFILENNTRKELEESIKSTFTNYERGVK